MKNQPISIPHDSRGANIPLGKYTIHSSAYSLYAIPLLTKKAAVSTTNSSDIPPANFNVGPNTASPVTRSMGSSSTDRVRNPR
mmetsp:Transcript_7964/g.14396  ORF Transcript_7964/g.14396 Transcript_7964/m.14396 type:complete len:83 (-) Transcript_7964:33-281(-)